ncbi:MAG: A24 family peptidase [Vulcanimicrobiaceae bacterium]
MALGLLIVATLGAAIIDLRCRRIPNLLTGALAFAGIALQLQHGVLQAVFAVVAMLVVFALGSSIFSAGWLGGGDIKLIAACCAVVGSSDSLLLVLEILIAGGIVSLAALLLHRKYVPYGLAIAGGSVSFAISTVIPGLRPPL